MHLADTDAVWPVPWTEGKKRWEPAFHGDHQQAVSGNAVVWLTSDASADETQQPQMRSPLRATLDAPHEVRSDLLKDVVIDRPNQVWCVDITYIPMRRGFLYLVAIMDWFSRKVLGLACWPKQRPRSAWTGKAVGSTTGWSKACGAHWIMNTFTFTPLSEAQRPRPVSENAWPATTPSARIPPVANWPRTKPMKTKQKQRD